MPEWQALAYATDRLDSDAVARNRAFATLVRPLDVDWWDETRFTLWPGEQLSEVIARTGSFEPATALALKRLLFPSACVIDAGANSGVYTVLAARWCEQVVAVEPSPRELVKLRHNIEMNAFSNVTVVSSALGAASGRAKLRVSDETYAGHNTLAPRFGYDVPLAEEIEVELTTIDALAAPADVIKIDVEGAEVDLLRGARLTLRTYRPALVIEVNPIALQAYGTSVEALDATLRELAYGLYNIDGATGDLVRIRNLRESQGENLVAMAL